MFDTIHWDTIGKCITIAILGGVQGFLWGYWLGLYSLVPALICGIIIGATLKPWALSRYK